MTSRIWRDVAVSMVLIGTQLAGNLALGQPTASQVTTPGVSDVTLSEVSTVASKMNFRNSMKLFLRQWSFVNPAEDAEIMRLYRIDRHRSPRAIQELFEAAGKVVLLKPRESRADEFIGRSLVLGDAFRVGSTEVFLERAGRATHGAGESVGEILVAVPPLVEGVGAREDWRAEGSVVFFDGLVGSSLDGDGELDFE